MFSFVFTADTTAIDTTGAPFYRLNNVAGTFTEGATSVTLTPTVTLVATAAAATPRINFFNATFDNGLGINDPSLASYDLSTSFGPLTVAAPGTATSFLTPTFNSAGHGFATGLDLLPRYSARRRVCRALVHRLQGRGRRRSAHSARGRARPRGGAGLHRTP